MKTSAIVSVPLDAKLHSDIRAASQEASLSQSEVMRQSLRFGLPRLRAAFAEAGNCAPGPLPPPKPARQTCKAAR